MTRLAAKDIQVEKTDILAKDRGRRIEGLNFFTSLGEGMKIGEIQLAEKDTQRVMTEIRSKDPLRLQ